ncbi:MAG: chemotaxis protein CheB [Opitutaceae bacterium]|nr:chemotaxis protein CheB [Opitutaceae bacterium]
MPKIKTRPGKSKPAPRAARRRAAGASEPAGVPAVKAPDSPVGPPIVGLGASAGGLEALELFLRNVPEKCGLAFVIVQHLDPTHTGIMAELLQRKTKMKVVQVRDRTRVRPDCVYVIPPNRDMSVLHGVLHLLKPAAPRGLRLPIDFFLRALAVDQRERSVGVILSGMGTDGTLGLKAIKEQTGVALVQDPATAKFDGMPRSAVEAGLADIVAPVEELPARLINYLRHTPLLADAAAPVHSGTQSQLEKIVILLRNHTGHDFALYKRNTLSRRVERRMGLHQLPRIADYVRYLRSNPLELDLLFRELLIGVTNFFRDPAVWEQLRDEALPPLLAGRSFGHALRAWVPGCSTGEEAYSLAIVFQEALTRLKPRGKFSLQIFATDLDRDAVDRARQGFYPANIAADVSPERLRRFFVEEEGGYRVAKEIREMVIFAPQNLIMDPPFTKLDILSCRNLLIYFGPELQKKLFPLFHYSLNARGVLLLGSAESVGGFTGLFAPLPGKSRLFRRKDSGPGAGPVEFPSAFVASPPDARPPARAPMVPADSLQAQAEQWLLRHHAPAAVLVNDQGDILFVSGRTGPYLEPAAGKANWNVLVMAREGLRYELISACQKSSRQPGPVASRRLRIGADGRTMGVDLTVQRIAEPGPLGGLTMIVFSESADPVPAPKGRGAKAAPPSELTWELERELRQARDEVQSTREEMQTSQEELKSMNEELQSTNEELQSTNEELTTSKEEMQSLNEELQTLNAELQAKLDELCAASNDMKNLLNSTEIATVFLDNALNVRRFTEQATAIINLIPGDVGRPVTDLASSLVYPDLVKDAHEVLRSLNTVEKALSTRDGRSFALRLMPYRTMDNRIDGVVITFTDLTSIRKLEASLLARTAGEK